MVVIFSSRKSVTESEIIKILTSCGGEYISDNRIFSSDGKFTVISEYKKTELSVKNAIALLLDNSERFNGQRFPQGITGLCENTNRNAIDILSQSNIPVISCGMDGRNTVTASSISENSVMLTLQRRIKDRLGNDIEPGEYLIKLFHSYSTFSVLAGAIILLYEGITPTAF